MNQDEKNRYLSAYKLLRGDTTTTEKFESVRDLVKGLNPKVDRLLEGCSDQIKRFENIKKGEVLELALDNLPEETEEEKKRKNSLIFFLKNYKELKSEIERIKNEIEPAKNQNQVQTAGRILSGAKGPFGVITLAAIAAVVTLMFIYSNKSQPAQTNTSSQTPTASEQKSKVKVITYKNSKIPIDQLKISTGPDCDSPHYHAKAQSVTALDGTVIPDPGSCAYGKVNDVQTEEVEI